VTVVGITGSMNEAKPGPRTEVAGPALEFISEHFLLGEGTEQGTHTTTQADHRLQEHTNIIDSQQQHAAASE
jgi:hypothetical protein